MAQRVTSLKAEVLTTYRFNARVTSLKAEVLTDFVSSAGARVTSLKAEVLTTLSGPPAPEGSDYIQLIIIT